MVVYKNKRKYVLGCDGGVEMLTKRQLEDGCG